MKLSFGLVSWRRIHKHIFFSFLRTKTVFYLGKTLLRELKRQAADWEKIFMKHTSEPMLKQQDTIMCILNAILEQTKKHIRENCGNKIKMQT